ncbi:quinol:cytochrome c oxidoreductase pentaheme cytochrome subunit [Arcticibacter pallidicorallinus]|uniref:Quinol:cytochrome c oxidoreductase pentaheme cytochrome subunit n=1 Tax=Arcticibacter pallidicorallinus TaxID=1259464 RepID=A0A2T0U8Q5_9SPHI|nr:cytochrome c3 family protein [Arcticibacter pallidicorallinus]PRY54315.1 quinol:cytochrome c oxidoreductase pentaheme cytochrome subunit [Arcticibacter pallidicorallinus]
MRSISLIFRSVVKPFIFISALSLGVQGFAQEVPALQAEEAATADAAPAEAAAAPSKGDPAAGAAIYKQKCTSCHAIDRAVVGPALKGMSERHDEQWLIKWIRNSQALVASGDPAAVKVFEEYNKVVMTPFPELTDDDIVNIIAYVQTEGDKPAAPAGGAAAGAEGAVSGDSGEVSNFMLGGLILVVLITLLVILVLNRVIKTLDRVILQKKGIAVEEDGVVSTKETAYEKIRRLSKNKKLVFFTILLVVILLGSWGWKAMWNTGVHQGYQPEQPIKYSHQLHAGTLKIDCQYCHTGAYKSKNATIPSLNVCMNCHNYVQATDKYNGEISPEIMKIYKALDYNPDTKEYGPNQKPIQWVRIHNLPDFAYFNHSQHVSVAGIECQQCHGPIQTMEEVYQYSPLTMKWCINCHREHDVNTEGNGYYDKVVEVHDLLKQGKKVTPAVLGGLECGKCHY